MKELRHKYSIKEMAQFFNISRQAYYAWLKRPNSKKNIEDKILKDRVKAVFKKNHETYGAIRISNELKEEGYSCGKERAGRLMKELNLTPKARKKHKVTTDSNHDNPVAPNILKRDFTASAPNEKWVGDITYIWTREGWLYLAVVIDLFSRKVVGWSAGKRINRELVIKAFRVAVKKRQPPPGLIFHSDRGSQYCSKDFIKELEAVNATQSMSRRGDCWDNAVAESFFHTLKVERLYSLIFLTKASARICIFDYIEVFYNRRRQHSYLKYLSPDKFERCYFFKELGNCA